MNSAPDSAQLAQDPIAAPTLAWMREGRWRKARDAAKDLLKRDGTRYLPLLIEANVGLAREMLGKGLVKEASTVVDYLATIAPAALVAGLRAELAAPVVKRSAPDPAKLEAAGWWAAALRVDAAAPADVPAADLAAIDLLVSDGWVPPAGEGDEREQRLARELAAVRAGCAATGDGRWEAAREALQGLPRQSVFRHWRLFLRGVRCFFEDEVDTARQCFGELPPHGALARAARAFDPGLVTAGPVAPVGARVPLYLAATGQPAAWGGPIVAAAAAWKAGKQVDAFETLLAGMKGVFPAIVPGLPARLTETTLPYRDRMDAAECAAADTMVVRFGLDRGGKKLQPPAALLAVMRAMCLAEAGHMPSGVLDRSWRTVIDLWNRCEGPNPLRDAVAWQWLGDTLCKTPTHAGPAGMFGKPAPDLGKARGAYEMAVEADPSNQPAALGLLALLQRQGDTKAHKRLLADLLPRFPRNKALLLAAAAQATKDKDFDKALVPLRAALAIDPLDKDVKADIMVALVRQTRELLRKKRSVAHQWAAMEPLLEDRPPRGLFMLSRWMTRMRQALLDPEPATARQAREEVVRLAPSLLERLLLENWLAAVYQVAPRPEWTREWKAALKAGAPDWATLTAVLDQHAFVSLIKEWNKTINARACTQVLGVLSTLLGKNLKKDPDGVLVFLDRAALPEKGLTAHATDVRAFCLRDVCDEFDDVDPSNKKLDPRLRLAALILNERSGECYYSSPQEFQGDLDSVAAAATARGLPEVAARAKALRDRVISPSRRGPLDESSGFPGPFDDEDSDEDFDEDFDEEEDALGGIPQLKEMLEMAIKSGSSQALNLIRDTLLGLGYPMNDLEKLIRDVTLKVGPAGPPPRTAKPKKPKPAPMPPPADPDQPELF